VFADDVLDSAFDGRSFHRTSASPRVRPTAGRSRRESSAREYELQISPAGLAGFQSVGTVDDSGERCLRMFLPCDQTTEQDYHIHPEDHDDFRYGVSGRPHRPDGSWILTMRGALRSAVAATRTKQGSGSTSSRSPGTFGFGDAGYPAAGFPGASRHPEVPYEVATSTELQPVLSNGSPPFRGHRSRRDPTLPVSRPPKPSRPRTVRPRERTNRSFHGLGRAVNLPRRLPTWPQSAPVAASPRLAERGPCAVVISATAETMKNAGHSTRAPIGSPPNHQPRNTATTGFTKA
jgi:hypothetical protein